MHYKWCACNKEGFEIDHNVDHNILDEIFEERVKEKNRVINNQPSIGFVCSPWNHPTTWFSIVHYSSSSFFFSYLSTFLAILGIMVLLQEGISLHFLRLPILLFFSNVVMTSTWMVRVYLPFVMNWNHEYIWAISSSL